MLSDSCLFSSEFGVKAFSIIKLHAGLKLHAACMDVLYFFLDDHAKHA